ncbi:MAG: DUF6371 domain-containing protein [Candidatus Marinimicrobia bacterium]|nr:DUF6371 domain-containing protein [Candidatus Neomarinimicrobiota bacterium]MCF7880153.1 DUF6371 domain-containing protein [Candidatus Neomarinimicrobiota bacterium]
MKFEELLSNLQGVKEGQGGQFTALCPAHKDHEPSLSVKQTQDGTMLLKCFTGCSVEAICQSIGIQVSDLFKNKHRKESQQHRMSSSKFVDNSLYEKCLSQQALNPFAKFLANDAFCSLETQRRFHIGYLENGFTVFFQVDQNLQIINAKQIKYDNRGHRIKNQTGFPLIKKSEGGRQILYGLWQLPCDRPVMLVESEKTAVIMSQWRTDFVWIAKGSAHGLTKEKAQPLQNRDVTLLIDADDAGRKTAVQDKSLIESMGCRVIIKDLFPNRNDGYDIADLWIDLHKDWPQGKDYSVGESYEQFL